MAGGKRSAKQVAVSYFKAVAAHDLDEMASHYKPGAKAYMHGMTTLEVPHTYRQWFAGLFRAIPDFTIEIVDSVAYGERAAVRWRASGTFNGEGAFEGLTPTGARVAVEGIDMLTIREGRIEELHGYLNEADMARQFGVLPRKGTLAERALLGAANARTAAAGLIERWRSRTG